MSWLDIILLIPIIIATLIGLKVGIIKAFFILAGVIAGVVLAGRYYVVVAEHLTFISQPSLAKIAAFAIILIGLIVIASVLAGIIKWAVSAVMLGWLNHLGGAVIGFFLGVLFCGALLTIWVNFLGVAGAVSESALAALLLDGFPMALALLPGEFDAVRSFFQR
ncbi:MAG: hypothetical protein A2144_08260 [Chloroflexi bacterium RBG_16_50_9]|nr:MAG: hypothetical protein A2144_08260 [Chloroflexi bacterium RBG_16_50_9]